MLLTNFQLITSDWYCQPIHPTCSRVSLTILVEKVLFRLNISNLSSFSSNLCSSHCHQEKVEEKVQTGFLSSWKNIKHCLFVHWTSFFLGLPFTSHVVIGKVVLVSPFVCPLLVASDFFFSLTFPIMTLYSCALPFIFSWRIARLQKCLWFCQTGFLLHFISLLFIAAVCTSALIRFKKPASSPEHLCP